MNHIYFLVRYIPFWAVPLLIISGEFAYVSWLRGLKRSFFFFMSLVLFCSALLLYYYWSGGPRGAVENLMKGLYYINLTFRSSS